jgi:hypothetical protein
MDHYLVVAKIRETLAVNKKGSQKFHIERFNLKKLNEVEVSNGFAALENLDAEVEINSIWETIRDNIKIPAKDAQNYYTRGNKLNCSGYRIQMK